MEHLVSGREVEEEEEILRQIEGNEIYPWGLINAPLM